MLKATHTRTKGAKLTYEVECTATGYVVRRNGKVLVRSGAIIYGHQPPDVAEATQLVVAKAAIEGLVGMRE